VKSVPERGEARSTVHVPEKKDAARAQSAEDFPKEGLLLGMGKIMKDVDKSDPVEDPTGRAAEIAF
jgi:hypothetical protein